MAEENRQLVVVGGGPGGYAAAFMAADLGLQVTLIDPEENPGGVCLYRGCIPTKALLHSASILGEIRRGAQWGLKTGKVEVELDKLRTWKDEVVDRLTGGLGQLARRRKVEHLRGRARFRDPRTLEVDSEGDAPARLAFDQAILATGGRPGGLPSVSYDSPRVMDSAAALRLEELPERLLVVGAGYIGMELATVYASLGSRVIIVEKLPRILAGTDDDLVQVYLKEAKEFFEAIRLSTTAELEVRDDGVEATLQPEEGEPETVRFDRVLLAVGRKPATADLGLENTAVELDDGGFIQVDEQRRTAEASIFAVGDVTGNPLFAHKATHEGRVAAEAAAGRKSAYEPKGVPAVEYIDPEIAWCGLNELQAQEQGRKVEVARFPWAASGRSLTLGRSNGLTKLVLEPGSGRVLGVGIVGPWAGELISEGLLAVEMGAVASDLALTVHPHPTLSETLMGAAEVFDGTATDLYRPRRDNKA
jgi:dihydrolipoamide dehydrogenase